ncbi:hypothetical protein PIN31009_04853 [Pandoraea iniqua]|nr:hypothetical protein PIN31009_04853 [Pandoraea iniqua]
MTGAATWWRGFAGHFALQTQPPLHVGKVKGKRVE